MGPQQKIVSNEFSRLGSGEAGHPHPWSLFQAGAPAQDPILACAQQKSAHLRLFITAASTAPLIAMVVTLEAKRALDTDSGETCI